MGYNLLGNGIYWDYGPLTVLTFYIHFQRDIQVFRIIFNQKPQSRIVAPRPSSVVIQLCNPAGSWKVSWLFSMLIILVPAGLDFVDQHHNLFFLGRQALWCFFGFQILKKGVFPQRKSRNHQILDSMLKD